MQQQCTTSTSSPAVHTPTKDSGMVGIVEGGQQGVPRMSGGSGGGGSGTSRVDSILAAAKRASIAAQSSSVSGVPEVG